MNSRITRIALACLCALTIAVAPASAATTSASPEKTLRWVFAAAETGFDPAGVHDYYSGTIVEAVFETLLTYDYLARPAKLVPLTAEALPQISDDGKTYTLKIR